MSDPMVIAAAAVLVISAFAAGAVSVIKAVGETRKTVLATAAKTDEIHTLVNSAASEAKAKLEAVEAKVEALHLELTQLQERRVEDAKTRAAAGS
jgi:hypothetical protein